MDPQETPASPGATDGASGGIVAAGGVGGSGVVGGSGGVGGSRVVGETARALALACHPLPTVAVTAISAGLAALAGLGFGRGLLVVTAILAGQLSIGWSNDSIDAARDRATERSDKPVASGAVSPRTVGVAAVLALAVCVIASLALGWAAGLASIVVAACGWAYNLGLKATAFSWLPYALAFGMLPAVATLALPTPSWPAPWAIISGALFGVSAHLANVLPDLTDDAATGVRGFPHRLGARASAVGCTAALFAASMVILFGSGAELTAWRWVAAAVLGLVAVAGVIIGLRRPTSRALFTLVIAVAVADLVLFAVSGASLT